MAGLFSLNFWFNMRPGPLGSLGLQVFIIILALSIGLTIIFWLLKSRRDNLLYYRVWQRMHSFGLSNIIVSVFLFFFFFEEIPILSSRFWLLLWSVAMGVWLGFVVKDIIKIPKIKEKLSKDQEYKKYIP